MEYDDWVIEEAAKRMGVSPRRVRNSVKEGNRATTVFCDLIQETQKPPVDPVLEEARERMAAKKESRGYRSVAPAYRKGGYDKESSILVAIDLINERNALQAELDALRAEPKPLNPHAPLEARHKDGGTVPVELASFYSDGDIRIKRNGHVLVRGDNAVVFFPDGTHWSGEWTLHNRVQS